MSRFKGVERVCYEEMMKCPESSGRRDSDICKELGISQTTLNRFRRELDSVVGHDGPVTVRFNSNSITILTNPASHITLIRRSRRCDKKLDQQILELIQREINAELSQSR
jgi:hypothetical protein